MSMNRSRVEVLLATYNGEKFLEEQLQSLSNQNFTDFKVLISDGGSTDGTLPILKKWSEKDSRFVLLGEGGRLGVKENFSRLMGIAEGDYLFFADQDDVWKRDKLDLFLKKMEELEKSEGKDKPLLVHSDLEVVNQKLEPIAPSFWNYIRLDPKGGRCFNRLILQNTVTGAACLINRPLLELARPIPPESVMHDWWLALVAIAFGKIGIIDVATVHYRQHGHNEVGAKPYSAARLLKFALSILIKGPDQQKAAFYRNQISTFAKTYETKFSPEQQKILKGYFSLSNAPIWKRIFLGIKYKFYHSGFLRNVAFLCFSRQ